MMRMMVEMMIPRSQFRSLSLAPGNPATAAMTPPAAFDDLPSSSAPKTPSTPLPSSSPSTEREQSRKDESITGAWKTVSRKKPSRRTPHETKPLPRQDTSPCPTTSKLRKPPPPLSPSQRDADVLDIEKAYARASAAWRASTNFSALERILRDNAPPRHASAAPPVSRAVCLGNGPMGPSHDWRRNALVQTAAFLSVVEILSELYSTTIRCFFQDPNYDDADRAFLSGMGHTVVDDPDAFALVTETTLLWGIHLYFGVSSKALLTEAGGGQVGAENNPPMSPPAMIVGTAHELWEDTLLRSEGETRVERLPPEKRHFLERLSEVDASHDVFALPPEGFSDAFSDTVLYWRRSLPSSSGEPGR